MSDFKGLVVLFLKRKSFLYWYQGSLADISIRVGTDNALGQAIKLVSEQTFYLLLDNIDKGNCPT